MTHRFDDELKTRLAARLAAFPREALDGAGLKRAAVAIAIAPYKDQAAFLLTRRAARLNAHGGQWALPGGRIDGNETPVEAALRELEEEVALKLDAREVIGLLDDYPTRSGYLITPVVIWAEDTSAMAPNPAEVASIHPIPLAELEREGSPEFLTIAESDRPVIRLHIGDAHVHAPTAALLWQFAEVGLRGRATRVAHLEQPLWAWR
ncbi:CoA pyrophosphatase [Parvibaculum sp.]|uniref:CoA pyrophosphatase n=1 Tax=Parvibaculum sp. TaxID=2024848 RepID=UPI0034A06D6F